LISYEWETYSTDTDCIAYHTVASKWLPIVFVCFIQSQRIVIVMSNRYGYSMTTNLLYFPPDTKSILPELIAFNNVQLCVTCCRTQSKRFLLEIQLTYRNPLKDLVIKYPFNLSSTPISHFGVEEGTGTE
jgi:hypothetical protein